jgi:hypothetical protein
MLGSNEVVKEVSRDIAPVMLALQARWAHRDISEVNGEMTRDKNYREQAEVSAAKLRHWLDAYPEDGRGAKGKIHKNKRTPYN